MRYRRLLAVGTGLILVLAACANDPGSSPTAGETQPPATSGGEATEEPSIDGTELERAEAGEFAGTTVEVLSQWIEAEGESFAGSLAGFAERTGIDIRTEGITDYETVLTVRVEGGNAPDIAQIAQPGKMRSFQEDGHLVNLSDFFDVDQLRSDYIESFIDLASVDGDLYGLYYKADLKSIVWYPNAAFEAAGYAIPETWDELTALSDQIVADGGTPWCISQEHGDATGWVATDWIEDVLLRTAPLETYDAWVAHEIAFDDPAILAAAEIVGDIFFTDGYVYGGSTAINSIWVGDSQNPMFVEDGPDCWLHKQAAWIPAFWPADESTDPPTPLYEPGVDSSFFYLPPIDEQYGRPVLGGGDMFVVFNDRPEVRAVMQFLATPEAAQHWIKVGGFVSPNNQVPQAWYSSYPSSGLADILANADALRFDASDTMPAEVGQGTFWSGLVEWVAAEGANTEEVFGQIESSWP